MANLRSDLHLRHGIFSQRLQIRPGRDTDINAESDRDITVNLLHYRFCRSRVYEASHPAEPECFIHGTQPIPDHHQWNPSRPVHRTVASDRVEEWNILRHL